MPTPIWRSKQKKPSRCDFSSHREGFLFPHGLLNWCLSRCLDFTVPLRGRDSCHLTAKLFVPPAAHFFTQKSVEKALRGHPLKPHFTRVGNRLVISCNGTPSKKTSCVCPARTLLHSSLFLSAFASGCLHRRSSLQDNCKTRHSTGKAENFR